MKRGIYLVANDKSADECKNLIYSIRDCGCRLPIRIIPFGGKVLQPDASWTDVKLQSMGDFPVEGVAFLNELHRRMPQCSEGLLRRFLCWFGEFDEFLYSDNDIVALMNWEELFTYLNDYDLVHADEEYTTKGRYNLRQPHRFEALLGEGALEQAVTAGHFLCRARAEHRNDFLRALDWMTAHPEVPIWHDQALMHVTVVQAKWRALNLCKPPHNWASSWAGDYKNILDIIRTIQTDRKPFSHLHYSGGIASGTNPIDELLFANLSAHQRKRKLIALLATEASGMRSTGRLVKRAVRKASRLARGRS